MVKADQLARLLPFLLLDYFCWAISRYRCGNFCFHVCLVGTWSDSKGPERAASVSVT